MNIEELVAGLKEKGMQDEEIKATLEQIKADIDAFLKGGEGAPNEEAPAPEQEENAEEKQKRVFGI